EDEFVRTAITQQLDRLLVHYSELMCAYVTQHATHGGADEDAGDRANVEHILANHAPPRDADSQRASDTTVDSVAALIARTAAAERQAATWEAQARRAQHQAWTATARLQEAEARAAQ
ncbi:MAG: hypothetical protein ACJ8CR_20655, partial [Roseiflexaceae bacterium]